jgi:hypothetical protein
VETAKAGCGHESWQLTGKVLQSFSDQTEGGLLMSNELPIKTLVSSRCEELGLKPVELVRRCGYQNTNKGLRRLEKLCRGDFSSNGTLIRTLPAALDVLVEVVTKAVEDTQRQLHEAQEAAWRAEFVPHAVILTERKIPQPIFVAAFIGVDRLRRVDFDLKQGPESYITQALNGVREKLARWKSDQIPTFGRPESIIVNYSPDYAVSYDLDGNAIQALDRAYRLGEATFSIGKRLVSRGELDAIFGRTASIVHIRQ